MYFQDLSRRCVSSLIPLFVLTCVVLFSYIGIVKWGIAILTSAICGVGIWEYCCLGRIREVRGLTSLCIGVGVCIVFAFFLSILTNTSLSGPLFIMFIGAVALFLFHFQKIEGAIRSIATSMFGLFYVSVPLGFFLKVLYLSDTCRSGEDGRVWLLYLLVVTKITDIGAYFSGRIFGQRKLAPLLSPKKTVVGAVVGFFSAMCFSVFFYLISPWIPVFSISLIESICLGAALGILGQLGDLGESLLKRDASIKDSNRLPGLGGVLDMLDSLLFTTPVIYFFLYMC